MHEITSMSMGNALAPNRRKSVQCTVMTSRRRSCNQRVGCLNNWNLQPLDLLNGMALGCYQPSPEVLIVLRCYYSNYMLTIF